MLDARRQREHGGSRIACSVYVSTPTRPCTTSAAIEYGRLNLASYSVRGSRFAASGSSTSGTPGSGTATVMRSISSAVSGWARSSSAAASRQLWMKWQAG